MDYFILGLNILLDKGGVTHEMVGQRLGMNRATVTNYESPFLIGYGFGVRTMLMGYYLKFDLAWGVEDFKNQGKEFYFSFGYDF